jgi:hypothetical protein
VTATPSITPSGVIGPIITYFGLTRADDVLVPQSGTQGGIPVFSRLAGAGFSIVVEGRPGPGGGTLGASPYDPTVTNLPDLQIVASRNLGNGSPAVCDRLPPQSGGIPAVDPPRFDQTTVAALNDFGCRFLDGNGQPSGRSRGDACVLFNDGNYDFVQRAGSTLQFCGFVDAVMHFPPGDTLLTARLRDVNGTPGLPQQIIVRIGP